MFACFCIVFFLLFAISTLCRCEEDARKQATEAGVSTDVALERDPDVLDTWFRWEVGGPARAGGREGVSKHNRRS